MLSRGLMTSTLAAAVLAVVAAAPGEDPTCLLSRLTTDGATSRQCLACHPSAQGSSSHAFDVELEAARQRTATSAASLRTAEEIVRRGLFLPNGQVVCLTCHDARSPWRYRLAIPPDAVVRAPVDPRDPRTFDPELMPPPKAPVTAAVAARRLAPGTEISSTPLCTVCHTTGD